MRVAFHSDRPAPHRHVERDEAIPNRVLAADRDCFASLAKTTRRQVQRK
jgi:hypothetical protein